MPHVFYPQATNPFQQSMWNAQDATYGTPDDMEDYLQFQRIFEEKRPKEAPFWEQFRRQQNEIWGVPSYAPSTTPVAPQKTPFRPYTGPRGLLSDIAAPLNVLDQEATGDFAGPIVNKFTPVGFQTSSTVSVCGDTDFSAASAVGIMVSKIFWTAGPAS